jgi:hypothetical protein
LTDFAGRFAIGPLVKDRVKVHGGGDEVDVGGYVCREVIGIACDVYCTGFVLVDIVFSEEKGFCLFHGRVDLDPTPAKSQTESFGRKPAGNEPIANGVNGLIRRRERLGYPCSGPVVTVVGRVRVRDVVDEIIDVVDVGLGEGEAEREDGVRVVFVRMRPTGRNVGSSLMEGIRRGRGESIRMFVTLLFIHVLNRVENMNRK